MNISCSEKEKAFSSLTKFMYYSEIKQNNFIEVFDLFEFLIEEFKKPVDLSNEKL